jgi:hypothetical protein
MPANYSDATAVAGQAYTYRVTAVNTIGDITPYASPAAGYPSFAFKSVPIEQPISIP